jgi:RTX calcium-binding nonapeptide repeat (4 copies)
MQGRLFPGVAAVAACAVAACCVIPSISDGASVKRGGNHGCNPVDGFIYSDHFFEAGDNVSFGFRVGEGSSLPRRGTTHTFASGNVPSGGGVTASNSCAGPPGAYTSVHANLGAGDDSARLDATGVPAGPDGDYGPIPKDFDSLLIGGAGDDTIRGHKGFDDINAGSGADVIKADDGKADVVKCGRGKDKADVDSKDDVSGCEKKT